MKVIVTGGNGYLGARISSFFARKGFDVIPVCFPAIPEDKEWRNLMFELYEGDIRSDHTISFIRNSKPDIIIHLVSLDHFESEKDIKLATEINVLPTWRLLDACHKDGLKKFIYFSTIQVYGRIESQIIKESNKTAVSNSYGLTHYLSENICDYFNLKSNVDVIIARLSNSYGSPVFRENNCWWLVVNDLSRSAFYNKQINLLSDGSPQRDFIHGDDVCEAVRLLVDKSFKNPDNVFHISSGLTFSILELAIKIRDVFYYRYNELLPISANGTLINEPVSVSATLKYQISNEKLKSLGFNAGYDLATGINELFDYFEKSARDQ